EAEVLNVCGETPWVCTEGLHHALRASQNGAVRIEIVRVDPQSTDRHLLIGGAEAEPQVVLVVVEPGLPEEISLCDGPEEVGLPDRDQRPDAELIALPDDDLGP